MERSVRQNGSCALLTVALLCAAPTGADATTGWGCFHVIGVAANDVLNVRAAPSATAAVVGTIDPRNAGVIALAGVRSLNSLNAQIAAENRLCVPQGQALPTRWCRISHYSGAGSTVGWVRRRYLTRSECP
jgi:hypothetical protein